MMGKIHEQITNEHFSSLTDENQKKDKMYMIKSNNLDLYGWYALKGQKLLAQGNALGYYGRKPVAL